MIHRVNREVGTSGETLPGVSKGKGGLRKEDGWPREVV